MISSCRKNVPYLASNEVKIKSEIQSLRLPSLLHFPMSPRKKQQPTAVAFESLFLFLLFRIERIHRVIDTVRQGVLDGVSGMNLRRLDKLDIFPVRALQDMLDDGVSVLWMAYTDAETMKRLTPRQAMRDLIPLCPPADPFLRMRVFPGGLSPRSSQMMKISSRSTL